jgi:hypothetical protein
MPILAIIKSPLPLMTKRRQPSSLHLESFVTQIWCSTDKWRATYHKGVQIVLDPQIGQNVEAYIDDVVVKSKKHGNLLNNIKETFDNLRKYKIKLKPKKCVFGVSSVKLLEYMVSTQGINANPKKVKGIEQLHPPRSRQEIHKLAGMMATLNRFISKLDGCGMPFYKLLCKVDGFQWDKQATTTFIKLK